MEEKKEEPFAHVLTRGVYSDKGEKVTPGTPAVLPPMPADAPKNRLGLARWLNDPANPLPARVTMNRTWSLFLRHRHRGNQLPTSASWAPGRAIRSCSTGSPPSSSNRSGTTAT